VGVVAEKSICVVERNIHMPLLKHSIIGGGDMGGRNRPYHELIISLTNL